MTHPSNTSPTQRTSGRAQPAQRSIALTATALTLLIGLTPGASAWAQSNASTSPVSGAAGKSSERNFYEVLDDVLADFEHDLKNGEVQGLRDLAIRNIATSENIPTSFKGHIEQVITERIIRTSKARVVQCLQCRAKRTTLNGDQVVISSPETNPNELARIAKIAGIANFMDVAFSYQPSGMVISLTTIEPETGAIVWSRSYNSETSRASAFRRGVDFSQTEDARNAAEYKPTIQYRWTAFYMFEPNVGGATGCLGLGVRGVERYDNRRKEVGFEFNYLKDASSLVNSTTATTNLYSGLNFTMLFVHAWNLIGAEENYNDVRGSVYGAVGGTYASGYLGGLVRAGYEWRLARHWAINLNLGYRPKATAFVGGTSVGSVSGMEYGLGISLLR